MTTRGSPRAEGGQRSVHLHVARSGLMTNKHEAAEPPETLRDRFRDAIAPRTLVLGLGVLLLQFGFILSYIGAFHAPAPHRIPVTVVAPEQVAAQVVDRLNTAAG